MYYVLFLAWLIIHMVFFVSFSFYGPHIVNVSTEFGSCMYAGGTKCTDTLNYHLSIVQQMFKSFCGHKKN